MMHKDKETDERKDDKYDRVLYGNVLLNLCPISREDVKRYVDGDYQVYRLLNKNACWLFTCITNECVF